MSKNVASTLLEYGVLEVDIYWADILSFNWVGIYPRHLDATPRIDGIYSFANVTIRPGCVPRSTSFMLPLKAAECPSVLNAFLRSEIFLSCGTSSQSANIKATPCFLYNMGRFHASQCYWTRARMLPSPSRSIVHTSAVTRALVDVRNARGSRHVGKEAVVAVELVRRPRGLKCKRLRKDDDSESEKDYYGDELRPGTTTSARIQRRRREHAGAVGGCFEGCFEKLVRGGTASEGGDGAGGTAKDPDAPGNGASQSEAITMDNLTKKLQSMQSEKERKWQRTLTVDTAEDLGKTGRARKCRRWFLQDLKCNGVEVKKIERVSPFVWPELYQSAYSKVLATFLLIPEPLADYLADASSTQPTPRLPSRRLVYLADALWATTTTKKAGVRLY
ncbi:hypothetical protein K438DRAFT_1788108 [Mycena galopus ATCC 62051]|nr:hypothetical protein K438DRAFT_1788108 [Mycena galopus ATCC 62051]